jgi:hypothetical protein
VAPSGKQERHCVQMAGLAPNSIVNILKLEIYKKNKNAILLNSLLEKQQ